MAGHETSSDSLAAAGEGASYRKRKGTPIKLGIGLLAALAVAGLLMHGVDRVREAAERAH